MHKGLVLKIAWCPPNQILLCGSGLAGGQKCFISKWQLSMAALELNRPIFVALLILSSLLNAVYYFPIIIAAFFNRRSEAESGAHAVHGGHGGHTPPEISAPGPSLAGEAPWEMLVPTAILAVGCFIFALTPVNWPLEMIKTVTHGLF